MESKDQPEEKATNKYAIKFRKNLKKDGTYEEPEKNKKGILQHGDFVFDECPTGLFYNERWLVSVVDFILWSEKMRTPMFDGGLNSYSAWYFKARTTVVGEQNAIESEEMKKSRDKANQSHKSGSGIKGRRGLGRRR